MEENYASIFCINTIKSGQPVCLRAAGWSMWPLITPGMRAVILPLPSCWPEKGSLLLIKRATGLVVHRYWGVIYLEGNPYILAKGDTNLAFDPPVPASVVLGYVSQLITESGDYIDPNRDWPYRFGYSLCSYKILARFWARCCRFLMKLQGKM